MAHTCVFASERERERELTKLRIKRPLGQIASSFYQNSNCHWRQSSGRVAAVAIWTCVKLAEVRRYASLGGVKVAVAVGGVACVALVLRMNQIVVKPKQLLRVDQRCARAVIRAKHATIRLLFTNYCARSRRAQCARAARGAQQFVAASR